MTDRIVSAYDLAQNPLCRHMAALESRDGWTFAALSELEPKCMRLDALVFDAARQRFDEVLLHFADEAQQQAFFATTDLTDVRSVRRY